MYKIKILLIFPVKNSFFPLLGDHQLENAKVVLACIQELHKYGYEVPVESIQEGFKSLEWPGRFEVVSHDPLIIIDCAHNRDSFRKLKKTLDTYLEGKRKILIFGASEDKEVKLMLSIIKPSIDFLIVTKAQHPRALDSVILKERADEMGIPCVSAENVEEGIRMAEKEYATDTVIIAAGSVFIAGAVKNILNTRNRGNHG